MSRLYTNVKEIDWAWLAGIIDGEGCITIVKQIQNNCVSYGCRIIIGNNSMEMLNKISLITGKKIIGKKKQKYIAITKQTEIAYILKQVLQYLTSKHEQAVLMLEYLDLRANHKLFGYRIYDGYSEKELKVIELLGGLKD